MSEATGAFENSDHNVEPNVKAVKTDTSLNNSNVLDLCSDSLSDSSEPNSESSSLSSISSSISSSLEPFFDI